MSSWDDLSGRFFVLVCSSVSHVFYQTIRTSRHEPTNTQQCSCPQDVRDTLRAFLRCLHTFYCSVVRCLHTRGTKQTVDRNSIIVPISNICHFGRNNHQTFHSLLTARKGGRALEPGGLNSPLKPGRRRRRERERERERGAGIQSGRNGGDASERKKAHLRRRSSRLNRRNQKAIFA